MKLSQSERIALGIARNDGNHSPMTKGEYKNIRKTLKLSQEGMGILLGCTRFWISKCEKDDSLISYAHAFILRLLMDAPQATRDKWIPIPEKGKQGRHRYLSKEQKEAEDEDNRFKTEGYVL